MYTVRLLLRRKTIKHKKEKTNPAFSLKLVNKIILLPLWLGRCFCTAF